MARHALVAFSVAGIACAVLFAFLKPSDWRWWLASAVFGCLGIALWAYSQRSAGSGGARIVSIGIAGLMASAAALVVVHLVGGWPMWAAEANLQDDPAASHELYSSALVRAREPGIPIRVGWVLKLNRYGLVPADEAYILVGMGVAESLIGHTATASDTLRKALELYIRDGRDEEAEKVRDMIDRLPEH